MIDNGQPSEMTILWYWDFPPIIGAEPVCRSPKIVTNCTADYTIVEETHDHQSHSVTVMHLRTGTYWKATYDDDTFDVIASWKQG